MATSSLHIKVVLDTLRHTAAASQPLFSDTQWMSTAWLHSAASKMPMVQQKSRFSWIRRGARYAASLQKRHGTSAIRPIADTLNKLNNTDALFGTREGIGSNSQRTFKLAHMNCRNKHYHTYLLLAPSYKRPTLHRRPRYLFFSVATGAVSIDVYK